MTLEDTAALISPRGVPQLVRLLECFRGGRHLTFGQLLRETGFKEKLLEYYLTRLRKWSLLQSERVLGEVRYFLTPGAFRARVEAEVISPVENLVGGG
jgi:hypothetical protein